MKKVKALIAFLMKNYRGSVALPSEGKTGINIFADISANLSEVERLAKACGLSVIPKKAMTNQYTGEEKPARAWIGKVSRKDVTEEALIEQLNL